MLLKSKSLHIVTGLLLWGMLSSFDPGKNGPPEETEVLFKIARSRDANEIWYTLNLDQNGKPDRDKPIEAFWIKKTDNNKIEPLTWVQNQYAYGIEIVDQGKDNNDKLKFQFVSYKKREFELRQGENNEYKVYIDAGEKEIEVARIFVQIDGGSFWVPSVSFVTLTGYEANTPNIFKETIIP